MKLRHGVWLPDADVHFEPYLRDRSRDGDLSSYQRDKMLASLAHAPGRRTAIDVGAHVGLWTDPLARRFDRVIAVEPNVEAAECLVENVRQHENVNVLAFALGTSKGSVTLQCPDPSNSGMTWVDPGVGGGTVPMTLLDDLPARDVDFLKLDCEGYEYDVLLGGMQLVHRWRPTIVVEQDPPSLARYGLTATAAVDLLRIAGYEVVLRFRDDYVMVPGEREAP